MGDAAPPSQPFRVIIAGGSLVGLTLARALEQAGIAYVLLEKREVAPSVGASISIHPHVQRVMEQLGAWPEIRAGVLPLEDRQHYDAQGTCFEDSGILREISRRCHNRCTAFMQREFWLRCIYNTISDKSPIRSNCGVASFIETSNGGVEVTTDSGEVLRGDLLVGADGVHSTVRNLLADGLDDAGDADAAQRMRACYQSTYHTIFATSRNVNAQGKPFLPERMVHNVYYPGFSGVAAAGVKGLVFWFLFVKSDSVTTTPDVPRFSEEDTAATIKKYGRYTLGPGCTFKELWDTRVKASMVPLEEGVVQERWRSEGGRVVLVGDAVHKATVNPGLGGNLAVEGVCHLMNGLVPLVRKCEEGKRKPTSAELSAVLDEYEQKQRPHANLVVNMSGYITRYEAVDTWWLNALRWASPWLGDGLKASGFATYMNEGPWLEFLPNPDDEAGGQGEVQD